MPNRYACFISYRHAIAPALEQRLSEIEEALNEMLAGLLSEGLYRDPKLNPGERYNAVFAEKMCHSYCLVVIYTPTYKESEYCRGEFQAMRDLESKRFEMLGAKGDRTLGMIIPIILRKLEGEQLPSELLTGSVHHLDISDYFILPRKLSKIAEVREQISKIAYHIAKVRRMLTEAGVDVWCDCQGFQIPRGVAEWQSHISRAAPQSAPFPFRGETR